MVWWRYPGSTPKGLILQIPPRAQTSTLIHLKTSLNTAPDNPTTLLTTIGYLPYNPTTFGAPESLSEFLRSIWGLSEGCLEFLKMSGSVFWYLPVSVVVWGFLEWCLGVFGVIFWDVGADWVCTRVYMWAQFGRDQVRTKPTHHFSTTLKGKFFSTWLF